MVTVYVTERMNRIYLLKETDNKVLDPTRAYKI